MQSKIPFEGAHKLETDNLYLKKENEKAIIQGNLGRFPGECQSRDKSSPLM